MRERADEGWVRDAALRALRGVMAELLQEFLAALPHFAGKLRHVIGEESKRRGRVEFLSHEQHRRLWREQHYRRHGAQSARARELMNALAIERIRYLIVVLNGGHESGSRRIESRRSARLVLP